MWSPDHLGMCYRCSENAYSDEFLSVNKFIVSNWFGGKIDYKLLMLTGYKYFGPFPEIGLLLIFAGKIKVLYMTKVVPEKDVY